MKRDFDEVVAKWYASETRKPLMVVGVRQIGKTYLLDRFCRATNRDYLFFNLDRDAEIVAIFEETIDPKKIIRRLELLLRKKINVAQTIFFFDEVQVSERFIAALKYFNESSENYKIVCAGSLLGVKINRFESSFPVGKVQIEHMHPLSFKEFMLACDEERLLEEIQNAFELDLKLPQMLHDHALERYREYLCVGGMPESVKNFLENNQDILLYDVSILRLITQMYLADMNKYTTNKFETNKIELTYQRMIAQLAQKESRKFKYNLVDKHASKRDYYSAISWLLSSEMLIDVTKITRVEMPLKAYVDPNAFKLYLSDVGLLVSQSELLLPDVILDKPYLFKGAITENYVACEFKVKGISRYYWTSGNRAEVDFLLYNQDGIIPVEVKASANTRSKSLNVYTEKYSPNYAIRISSKHFGFENGIKSVPLYAVWCI
ncbi:ATPase [Lactococcus hodotermopsidis]|uniref:ATPase n=1 Tax=Pseudolactococcus hodotermopsidis TaxID=2709157 RepID=A0A6A0BC05_9LACT|nr:AAA family ATPase [Lactococcus hodotermopsidis]GFH42011.1 ATPase [Lactococcus hodotermopsidis]